MHPLNDCFLTWNPWEIPITNVIILVNFRRAASALCLPCCGVKPFMKSEIKFYTFEPRTSNLLLKALLQKATATNIWLLSKLVIFSLVLERQKKCLKYQNITFWHSIFWQNPAESTYFSEKQACICCDKMMFKNWKK